MALQHDMVGHVSYDGVHSSLFMHKPEHPQDHAPVVICIPGMGISSEFYKPFADQLARAGLIACRTDLRGNGSSEVRASKDVDFGYFDLAWISTRGSRANKGAHS